MIFEKKQNLTEKLIILKWTQKMMLMNWMIALLEIKLNFGQEESHTGTYGSCTLNPKILKDVAIILNRVAQKSARLIGNYTTNLAEC